MAVAKDDPLAETGFYESEMRIELEWRDVLHFGLLPTPRGLVDRHALSVFSLTLPAWAAVVGLLLVRRRREKRNGSFATIRA